MSTQEKVKLLVSKTDHDLMMQYAKKHISTQSIGNNHLTALLDNLQEAEPQEVADLPRNVVRLNSRVVLRDKVARHNYTYTLVMPDAADHRRGMVSAFSPIGAALFGAQTGEDVNWQSHAGKRYFTVMSITQLYG
jgi:transcription elongation GreA/GreB family factor